MLAARWELQGLIIFFADVVERKGDAIHFLQEMFQKTELQKRFAGVLRDGLARGIAEANQLMPVSGFAGVRGVTIEVLLRIEWRRKRDGDVARTREPSAFAQNVARAGDGNRNDRRSSGDGSLECAELKGAHAVFREKSSFREDKNRLATMEQLFEFLGLIQPRVAVRAIEGKMAHFLKKGADERNAAIFDFGDEAIADTQAEHQRQHVDVAAVIGGVDFCAGSIHVLFAYHLHAISREGE